MRVKCVLCDKIEIIPDETLVAKRLRNRPIHTYMCNHCSERITEKTKLRIQTDRFRFYRGQQGQDNW